MQKSEHFTPITVGIMGGSASGKTTFANALAEQLSEFSPVVLNQDSYFRDWSESVSYTHLTLPTICSV